MPEGALCMLKLMFACQQWHSMAVRTYNQNSEVADSRRPAWGIFLRDTACISLWFNEAYTSLNHNEICRIPYENTSRTGVRRVNLPTDFKVQHIVFFKQISCSVTQPWSPLGTSCEGIQKTTVGNCFILSSRTVQRAGKPRRFTLTTSDTPVTDTPNSSQRRHT